MKIVNVVLFLIFCFLSANVNADQPPLTQEQRCKKNVDLKIQAIESVQENTHREESIDGLTITQIKKIQASQGTCAASDEIDKRIQDASKRK